MRKAARFARFLAPYGANFAYEGAVPVSQSDENLSPNGLHASMTPMELKFSSDRE
jgi:hypothetical protein